MVISKNTLRIVLSVWLMLESGQFFQKILHWGTNPLFWPLWMSVCLVVILATNLLDQLLVQQDNSRSQDNETEHTNENNNIEPTDLPPS